MCAAFSSDTSEEMRLVKEVPPTHTATPPDRLDQVYELSSCVEWIKVNNCKSVALQFPDELLCDSISVAERLGKSSSAKVFILGDTSYGSCCVDEVAAEHHDGDAIIHFGHTCLSSTRRLPVKYVFGQWQLDVDHCVNCLHPLINELDESILLVYDLHYHYIADKITERLQKCIKGDISVAKPDLSVLDREHCKEPDTDNNTISMLGRTFNLPRNKSVSDLKSIVYIGQEGRQLTNWMMNLPNATFYSYNDQEKSARVENGVNRQVMKRFFMIEKAKDAQIVGILVGTLGVAGYLPIIEQLKTLVRRAGKKSYTFVVGKLNVAKLANFMEVDVYVLVSCPENTLIDSADFYRPIVTPFEMEMACNQARSWTGDYLTDFTKLLPGAPMYVEPPAEMICSADMSLVTGGVRTLGLETESSDNTTAGEIAERMPWTVGTVDSAGDRLAERSWQGLEQKLGETPVTKAVEGRRGIAMGYKGEPAV